MKQIILSILLFAIIFLGSCSSTEDDVLSFTNSLSATIDGSAFTADDVIMVQNTEPQSGAQIIVLTATAGVNSEEVMTFNLFNLGGPGTYPLGSNSNWASYTDDALNTTNVYVTSTSGGEITITESNQNGVKGTFSFEAIGSGGNKILVEDGSFEARY